MSNYYGGFISSTFSEVFPDLDTFLTEYNNYKSSVTIYSFKHEDTIKSIYFLLASEYAFSHHIGARDQFKLMLFTRILEYGPFLERELEVQKDLLSIDIAKLQEGSKAIYNTALNPGTVPSDTSLEELEFINQQNTTNYKKSKPEAYSILLTLLNKDLIKDFISKFKNLFIRVCYPDYPLLYINDPTLTTIEGE